MARYRVLLVRHGESEWNAQRRWQGQGGLGLTARGHAQASLTAQHLAASEPGAVGVIHSDLLRVVETAKPTVAELDAPVLEAPAWRELDVGAWEGLTHEEIEAADPELYWAWRGGDDVRPGGGESDGELRRRIRGALDSLVATQPEGTVVVFTHGGPVRAAVAEALELSHAGHRRLAGVGNCSITALESFEGSWRLACYNDRGHLTRVD